MMINVLNTTELKIPGTSQIDGVSVSNTDVNFFNAMMPPSLQPGTTHPAHSQNLLSEAASTLNSMTNRMTKSLRALGSSDKYEEARKYPEQLSQAVLLQHMLTKCVGKAAQGIDKISNLQ
ncbi:EscI/YscI/HrpB family type III secretion system inner rod protein [Pseudomonas sp. CHM02]|uniref:EscI/YscI/HrpB family type III secretion system inner rod protein n=1 Tax=Pseudomonas sp. CHM02 TaxID=1463662 RepID=UPI00046EE2C5|nr:EscI/YscI/HrpB family type III secretion system inner rod protein [Pseudomonas sp. CHM02]